MEFKVGDMVVRTCSEECSFFLHQDSICRRAPEEFKIVDIIDNEALGVFTVWGDSGSTESCPTCCLSHKQTYKVVGNALVLEEL